MQISLNNISKHYANNKVLDNVNLELDNIKSLVLIGPSGGGKTTLLRILAGLEEVTSGTISINGNIIGTNEKELEEYRKTVGIVFQAYNLFPHLTALQNVMLPLEKVHNYSKEDAKESALSLLKRFNLTDHIDKKPAALSGGQQQRVAICRAVVIKPQILFLDEPTSALDPEYTSEVLDLIEDLHKEGIKLVLVTHEMGFAKVAADHIAFIADGGIVSHGSVNEIFYGKNPRVKQFIDKVLKYG